MSSLAKPRFTPEQYLDLERQAAYKSEYHSGEIFAMAGASFPHNLVVANVISELRNGLRGGPCRAVSSDQRVLVKPTGLYTYPDVVVVCGQAQFSDDYLDTIINPTVLIEVLSPSTELYDRGEKFAHYQRLESLTDYILMAQNKLRIEHYKRQTGKKEQWLLSVITDKDADVSLQSIGCTIAVKSIYENVEEN